MIGISFLKTTRKSSFLQYCIPGANLGLDVSSDGDVMERQRDGVELLTVDRSVVVCTRLQNYFSSSLRGGVRSVTPFHLLGFFRSMLNPQNKLCYYLYLKR